MATLEVLNDPNGRRYVELTAPETVVGRYQFCDVVLRSHTVSRQHARILRTDEGFFLEDMASLNGTYVNRQKIEGRRQLKDQDRIHIFENLLIFHDGSPSEARQAALDGDTLHAEGLPILVEEEEDTDRLPAAIASRTEASRSLSQSAQSRFRAALKIAQNLAGSFQVDEMLPKILDSLFDIFPQADRGYVLLAEEPHGHLVPRAIKHRQSDAGLSMTFGPISRKTAARVMSEGEAILMDDSEESHARDDSHSIFDSKILSMICAPLMGPSRQPLGIIYVDTADAARRFAREDLDVLVTVSTVAGQAVEAAFQPQVEATAERRQVSLNNARQVQLNLLPQKRPQIPGYRFYDYYQAADEIGGDYFGYIPLPDGRLALAIGDVAGKGVSAALLMAHFCSEVRYRLTTSPTPAEAVGCLNQDLSAETLNYHFVTFVLCVLDPARHTLTVVNAGHMPPLRRRGSSGRIEELGLSEGGLPLGCDPQKAYDQLEVNLLPGDEVILYTDGISEAMNANGDVYGASTVRNMVRGAPQGVDALSESLLGDVRRFMHGQVQSDDICLVCFGRDRQ